MSKKKFVKKTKTKLWLEDKPDFAYFHSFPTQLSISHDTHLAKVVFKPENNYIANRYQNLIEIVIFGNHIVVIPETDGNLID